MPVNRIEMIEYIAFVISQKVPDKDTLFTMFQDKKIYINDNFYEEILKLMELYEKISSIYNNSTKLSQFLSVIKKSLSLKNRIEDFSKFLNADIFTQFNFLFLDLVNGEYDIPHTRAQNVKRKIDLPFLDVIMKYDFYLEGRTIFQKTASHPIVAYTDDRFLIAHNKSVDVYDLNTKILKFTFNLDRDDIGYIKPLTNTLIFIGFRNENCTLYNLDTKQQESGPDEVLPEEDDIAIFPDGRFAFKSSRSKFGIWDPKTEETTEIDPDINLDDIKDDYIEALAILRDGRVIISTYNHEVQIWSFGDNTKATPRKEISFKNYESIHKIIHLGNKILTPCIYSIKIWDLKGQLLNTIPFTLPMHLKSILEVPNDKLMFSSMDGDIYLYDINTTMELIKFVSDSRNKGVMADKLLPSGEVVMKYQWNNMGTFNPDTHIRTFVNIDKVESIYILPNNQVMLVSNYDVKIWS